MLNVPIKAQNKTFKSTKSIIPFIIMLVCPFWNIWTFPLKAKNDPELAPMVVKAETGQPGVNSPLLKDGPEKDQGMLFKEIRTVVSNNKQKDI